jgi:signal peptidase II
MAKVKVWLNATWIVLLVAAIVIGLDQASKEWVRMTIPKHEWYVPIPALDPYFVFEHVDNYGAAFGILQGGGNFFIVVAAVVTVGILIYATRLPKEQWLVRVLLGMMLGGALGNVIDRINQGYVTDYVKMGIPGLYYWPNYNIADSAIVIGVILLAIDMLVQDYRQGRARATAEPADSSPSSSEV